MTLDRLAPLLSMDLTVAGEAHGLKLRVPLWSETLTAILRPEMRVPARLAGQLGVRIYDLIAADGATRPSLSTVKRWLADPAVAQALVKRHRDVIETASEAGKVYVGCPGCDAEVELTLTALAIAVGSAMPPVFEGPFFALPPLASWPPRPRRDAARSCRHLRVALPSHEIGIGAPLHHVFVGELDVDPEKPREAAVWRAWSARTDIVPGSPQASWAPDAAGFRVSVRLTVALDDPRNGAVDPMTVGALPVCDVFFLNTVYWLVYAAALTDAHDLTCPQCATRFAPVR